MNLNRQILISLINMGGNTQSGIGGKGSQSNSSKNHEAELNQNFTFLKTVNDPKYGNIKIYEERFPQPGQIRQTVMLIEVRNDNEAIFNIQRNKITRRADTRHPNLASLVSCYSGIEKEWCLEHYTNYILYEYCPITLENELHDRNKLSSSKSAFKVFLTITNF